MRRTNWKTVSTLVTMIIAGGCAEAPSAPSVAAPVSVASVLSAPDGRPTFSLGESGNNGTATASIGPEGGTITMGNSAVVFPAGSICDPATSSYGPGTWDDACTPLTAPITITATIKTTGQGTWVDFSPALRFVPSTNSSRWVWLALFSKKKIGASELSRFNIYYAATLGGAFVDETASDATLRTYVDTKSGVSTRRIKHFSGYGSWGDSCDPSVDPTCTDVPPPAS